MQKIASKLLYFISWAVFTIDGLASLAISFVVFAIGGAINALWPSSYIYFFLIALGIVVVMVVYAVIVILAYDLEEKED